jgi:SiaC family regulatory phosphoprotein
MNKVHLPPSASTPEIFLDFESGKFLFSGESFPQNPEIFLDPIRIQLLDWFQQGPRHTLDFQFKFDYLDSPSIKFVMDIIEEIEELNHHNKSITVSWYYPRNNKTLKELGQEIASELSQIRMAMIPKN